jgi:hypothetical protein
MLTLLQYIFSEWYIFLGVIILIEIIANSIATIIGSFMKTDKNKFSISIGNNKKLSDSDDDFDFDLDDIE